MLLSKDSQGLSSQFYRKCLGGLPLGFVLLIKLTDCYLFCFQAGNPNAPNMGNLPPNFGPQSGMPPPLPPGPPPHGQTHQ